MACSKYNSLWNCKNEFFLYAFHAKDSRLLISCIKSLYLPLSALSSVDQWHPGIDNNIQIALGLIDLNRQQICYSKRIFSVSQRSLSVHPLCAPFWLDDWFSATCHRPSFHSWPPPIASSLLQKLSSLFFWQKGNYSIPLQTLQTLLGAVVLWRGVGQQSTLDQLSDLN